MSLSIAVLGSSRTSEDNPDYQHAVAIGREIARRGGRVVCGGGGGTMEAVCRGAAQASGRSLGILVGEGEPNRWVSETVREPDLGARLRRLTQESAAAIFLPRGLGTMLEIAWMAESIAKGLAPTRPLVFLGLFWRRSVALVVAEAVGPAADALPPLIRFARNPEEAVDEAYRA
ncbi:MAG TPA: LOG family protein [Thermoanaerobaculia bacterium]